LARLTLQPASASSLLKNHMDSETSTSIFKLHQYNVEQGLNSSPFTTPSPHRCLHCFFQKISMSTWMHLKP
ncbi:unnamed protein product, partial [Arabidopsis halleri]